MQSDFKPIYTTRAAGNATDAAARSATVEEELLLTLGEMNKKIGNMTTAAPMDDYTHTPAEVENLKNNKIVEPLKVVQSMDLIFPA